MNFRRGLFRFCILASIIWLVTFGYVHASDISDAIAYWRGTATVQISSVEGVQIDEELLFPVNTPLANVEASIRQGIADGKVTIITNWARLDQIGRALREANNAGDAASAKAFADEISKIRDTLLPVQRAAYDELVSRDAIGTETSLSKYTIVEMPPSFYKEVNKKFVLERAKLQFKANAVLNETGVVLLVPILVLVFGWAVAWMLRGFKSDEV